MTGASKSWGGALVSRGTFKMKRATKKCFPEMLATGGRAVASMYSWGGGVGQKFPHDERNFRIFHDL